MEGVPLIRKTIPSAQSAPKQVDQPYSTLEKDEAESIVDSREKVNVSLFEYLKLVQHVVNKPWKSKLLLFVITIAPLFVQGLLVYLYSLLTVVPEVIVQGKKEGFVGGVIIPGIIIILVMSVIIVASTYCANYLGVYWRKLLTDHVSKLYFRRRMYYYLNCVDTSMDNSDQRIAQDINTLTTTGIFVYSSVLGQLVALIMFSIATVISPIGWKGLLVCYFFVLIAYVIALPLTVRVTPYVFAEEKSEGYFRYAQARIRTYVESIAFYNGEEEELLNINNAFRNVLARSILVLRKQFPLNCFSVYMTSTRAYMGQLLIALQLFYGIFSSQSLESQTVEEITKTILVISVYFTNIMTASMSLISIASQISIFVGTVRRVGELMIVMNRLQNPELESFKNVPIRGKVIHNNKVEFQNVSFYSPIGKLVVSNLSFQLETSMIIMGPSGIGKSSILRVLASLWPVHEGSVIRPLDVGRNGIMFLPQRPYMVIGGLKDQLLYPEKMTNNIISNSILENKLRSLLELVKLEYLIDRIEGNWEKELNWEDFLSLGEQQRIAFARLFYHKPHFAIIDEGTSALDIELESHIYNLLKSQNIKYLSVGHRPGLIEYHDQILTLVSNGEWKIDKTSQDISFNNNFKEGVELEDTIDIDTNQPEKDCIKKDIEQIQKESQHQSINKEFWQRLKTLIIISSTNTKSVVAFIGLCILSIAYGIFSSYMNLLTAPLSLAIAQKDKHSFLYYMMNHVIGWLIFSLMCGVFQYFGGVLTVYVRQQITSFINARYFQNKTYYKLLTLPEKDGNKIDNPDQRICNDVYGFALQFISIFFLYANGTNAMQGIVPSLCTFLATIYYVRNMPFLPTLINAIIYTSANIIFMYWISVKISKWTFTQAKLQGTFRYSHARLRSYAESIAFYDGELQESKNIMNEFDRVMENNYKLIFYQSLSTGGTVALLVLAESLGYFIIAITLLWISPISSESQDTTVLLNEFVTIFSASLLFNGALAGFTLSFNTLGQVGGYTNRVGELISKITNMDSSYSINNNFIESIDTISFDNVSIRSPANKIIAENLSFVVDKNTLITGPSGSGKSSILRVLLGIWPIEKGVISKPFNLGRDGLFFLPQRPYMIIGNLRQQLVYPSHNINASPNLDRELEDLLKLFELDHILKRIDNNWDATLVWEEILSLGEQQRIAMARLFFQKPAVSILDECTSALSVDFQQKFYELCSAKKMLLLSVGHRPELIQFHEKIIKFKHSRQWEIVQ